MSDETPLGRPVEVTLHIGAGKTGTSSIQHLMRHNRALLMEHDLLYPESPGKARHRRVGLAIAPDDTMRRTLEWHRVGRPDPTEYRRQIRRRLVREVRKSGRGRVLLSDEGMYGASPQGLQMLRRLVRRFASSTRVLVYVRRQDDHVVSRYQQVVKTGSVERLTEYVQRDLTSTYDYGARLAQWQRVLRPDELVVRVFERSRFVGGSLYDDFLASAGTGLTAADLEPVARANDSLDAESVEFLRILNLHRVEHRGATAGLIDNRPHFKALFSGTSGPTLTLPAATLDRFMEQWEEGNRHVAREILGDPEGMLFRDPRKASGTTTVQELDPARVDHFLELLDIPEEDHEGIRRIAEREARGA